MCAMTCAEQPKGTRIDAFKTRQRFEPHSPSYTRGS